MTSMLQVRRDAVILQAIAWRKASECMDFPFADNFGAVVATYWEAQERLAFAVDELAEEEKR